MRPPIPFIFTFFFLSSVIWSRTSVNPILWSLFEVSTALLFLRLLLGKKPLKIPRKGLMVPLLLLVLWGTFSLSWSAHFHATLMSLYKIAGFILAAIIFLNEKSQWEKAFEKAVRFFTVLGGLLFLLFWIFHRPNPGVWVNHPNFYCGFLALGSVFAAGEFLSARDSKRSWIAFSVLAVGSTAVFLAGSLGPVLGLLAGTLFLAAKHLRSGGQARRKIRGVAAAMAAWIVLSLIPVKGNFFHHIWERRFSDAYSGERIQIWKDSLNIWKSHFWRGAGLGAFDDVYPQFKTIEGLRNAPYAHNEILNFACEAGFVGVLILVLFAFMFIRQAGTEAAGFSSEGKNWTAPLLSAFVQSLFDFNLHYLPIALVCVFALCQAAPSRTVSASSRTRKILAGLLFLAALIFSLPGIAAVIFFRRHPHGASQTAAARWASKIDPFNGLYRSETGRMRDLLIALELQPRNVWNRRKAARFFLDQWFKTGDPLWLEAAQKEYRLILELAPNVREFRQEAENISREGRD